MSSCCSAPSLPEPAGHSVHSPAQQGQQQEAGQGRQARSGCHPVPVPLQASHCTFPYSSEINSPSLVA